MSNESVIFTFEGETADLEASVSKAQSSIDGLGSTTKATSDKMSKSMGKATKATTSMDKATSSTSASMGDMNAATGKAQESIGALGSAISVVNPEMGAMVQQSSALIGGFKGVTSGAGALGMSLPMVAAAAAGVAVAVGAAALAGMALHTAWKEATQESRTLEASIKNAQKALDPKRIAEAAKAWESMKDVIADLEVQYRVAEGSIDQYDIAAMKAVETIRQQGAAEIFLAGQKAAKLKLEQLEIENLIALGHLNVKEQANAQLRIQQIKEEFPLRMEALETAREEVAQMAEDANARVNQIRQLKAEAEARRNAIGSRKESTEVIEEEDDLLEQEVSRLEELEAAMESLREIREASVNAELSERDKIESARQEAMDGLESEYEAAKALLSGDKDEKLALERAFESAKLAIVKEFQGKRDEFYAEAALRQQEARQLEIENAIDAAQIIADATATIADEALERSQSNLDALREYRAKNGEDMTQDEKAQLNARIKAEKKAMRQIAIAQKLAAIMDIGIKTAQGIMSVWAQFGAYPPVAAALSAVVGAAGTASAIGVASQKVEFHRGGVVDAALLPGEAVLNRQATESLGNQGVDALNSGKGGMGTNVTLQIGRREAREIVRTDVRSGGMITQEIGRIANTFGNAGVSGLPVLA